MTSNKMHQLKLVLVGGAVVMVLLGVVVVSSVADYLSHPRAANVTLPPVTGAEPTLQPTGPPLPTMLPLPAPGTAPTPDAGPGASGSGRTSLDQVIQQLLQRRRSRRPG